MSSRAGLGGDGLEDEVVGQAGLVHAEDGIVGHEGGLGGAGGCGADGLRAFEDGGRRRLMLLGEGGGGGEKEAGGGAWGLPV